MTRGLRKFLLLKLIQTLSHISTNHISLYTKTKVCEFDLVRDDLGQHNLKRI